MDILEWMNSYARDAAVYKVDIGGKEKSEKILNEFKEALNRKRIIFYGAGTVGRVFYRMLKEMDITVECIVDKDGGNVSFLDGIKVRSPEHIKNISNLDDCVVIVTVNRNLYQHILNDLKEKGLVLKNIVCGHDLHMIAQAALCMVKAYGDASIIMKNCYECTNLDNTCWSLNKYLKRINNFKDQGKGTKAIRMMGYALSNICTLKCKNCCESVPYMPADIRRFIPGYKVIEDIKHLSSACNFLTLLEFIGGEPFLHPDLAKILCTVLEIKNIGIIHIFTNGTVVPSDEVCEILKNEKFTVYISNYQATLPDKFLKKVEQTDNKLKECNVNYYFGKKQNWMDFSGYTLVNTDDELEQVFEECYLHNCNRLQDGTLYVCAHQYAGMALGELKDTGETIQIHDYTPEELAVRLEEFKSYKTIDACRYCTMPYKAKIVMSGEQI